MRLKKFSILILLQVISVAAFSQGKVNTEELIKTGNQKESKKDYQGAINDFTVVIKQDSDNVNGYYYRGYVYYELKKYPEAINDFNKAIELDSMDVESFFNRGNAKYEMKNYKDAISDYSFALSLNPKDRQCYYNKAIAEYNLGDMENVCRDLEQAAKLGDSMAAEVIKELCK